MQDNKTMKEYLEDTLFYLHRISIWDGVLFIDDLVARWVDLLIDRHGNTVPERVSQYVDIKKMSQNVLSKFSVAEAYWRALYLEYHMRMLRLAPELNDEYSISAKIIESDLSREDRLKEISRALADLPIAEAYEWIDQLVGLWAGTYDLESMRSQRIQMGPKTPNWPEGKLRYYPIVLLSDLSES